MVSLTMLEQLVAKLWPQYQHAAVSLPDNKKGEQIIILTTYREANREELIQFARLQQIGEIAFPKRLLVVDNIPLLGTGKTDYISATNLALTYQSLNG